jgi:DnaK suppressor protein
VNTLERNSKWLRAVNAALARMEEGTFGICADCKEKIGSNRLAAVPWASNCITCQEAAERVSERSSADIERKYVVAA